MGRIRDGDEEENEAKRCLNFPRSREKGLYLLSVLCLQRISLRIPNPHMQIKILITACCHRPQESVTRPKLTVSFSEPSHNGTFFRWLPDVTVSDREVSLGP